jgi:hypothetical protein
MATALHAPEVEKVTPTRGRHSDWLAPLIGAMPLVLGLAGLVVLEGSADRPELDAPPQVILDYFGDRDTVIFGSFLLMLAAVAFIWFVGVLCVVLHRAENGDGRLSAIAYGGGLLAAAMMLIVPASNLFGALYADLLSPAAARTFYLFGDVFLYPAGMAAAVLIGATGLLALRTGVLPRWLGWASLVLALWLLIPPIGTGAVLPENPVAWTGIAALPGIVLWAAVTAVVVAIRGRGAVTKGDSR